MNKLILTIIITLITNLNLYSIVTPVMPHPTITIIRNATAAGVFNRNNSSDNKRSYNSDKTDIITKDHLKNFNNPIWGFISMIIIISGTSCLFYSVKCFTENKEDNIEVDFDPVFMINSISEIDKYIIEYLIEKK